MNPIHNPIRAVSAVVSAAMLFTLVTGCSKMRMARHQQRADQYFAAGDYSKAEIEYLNVCHFDHTNGHAIARLGTIYYEEGRMSRSYAFIARACELFTNDLALHLKLGTIYQSGGRNKEARDQAGFVLDKSPTNSEAPALMAEAASSPAEREVVRRRLESLSKRIGDTSGLELAYGVLDLRANDVKGAEAAFRRAEELDPRCGGAYFAQGSLYSAQKKFKEADAAFHRAADLAEMRSPRRVAYAAFKIANGDVAGAKRLLDEITKAAPDYLPAWISEARIALDEKRYADCGELLDRVLTHDEDNYEASLMQGQLDMIQNHPDKASADFERMTISYPRAAPVQYELALARLQGGDINGSISSLNQALSINTNYVDAILTLAELNIRKGNGETAIASLSQLVHRQPRMAPAELMLADAYISQNNLDEALAVYQRIQEQFPNNAQYFFLTGAVLSKQNKLAEARRSFERALELAPHFPNAVEELVNLDIAEKQYSTALGRVKSELDWDTNGLASQLLSAKVHIARAIDTAKQAARNSTEPKLADTPAAREDVNQAEAELLKAIDLKPDLTASYLMLAQLYVAAGKEQEALSRLTALAAKTNSVAVYNEIGRIYDALTNYQAAADAYEKVIAIDPNFSPAVNDLACLYSERLNRLDKAYPLAEKARQLLPDNPATADTLGWVLYQRGEYRRALELLSASAATLTAESEVQFHLGMTEYMLGEEDAARANLERAAKWTRDFPGKEEISRRLAMLAIDVKTADAKTLAELEKHLQSEPNDSVAANRLAMIYERDGALEKAAKIYEQRLAVNSQDPQIMGPLARLYLELNDTGKALNMAKQAHSLAPEDPMICWTLGRLVYRSGDYTWAMSLLQEAADKLPDKREVLYDLAWSYYSMGRVRDAETSMQQALTGLSAAKLEDANRFVAMVAANESPAEAQKAEDQARKILAADPNYVPAVMVLALQQEQQGKHDEAKKLYEKALTSFPAFWPAARALAMLSAQHPGDDQEAYEQGMKARAVVPDDADLAGALGVIAYRRGNYSQSAQLLKTGVQKLNNDGQLLYYLGKADYQLKQKQESKDAFQRALSLNLESDLAADARKMLAELK